MEENADAKNIKMWSAPAGTLDVYAQAITPAKIDAQGDFLHQMLGDQAAATA